MPAYQFYAVTVADNHAVVSIVGVGRCSDAGWMRSLASAFGSAVLMLVFWQLRNTWSLHSLSLVMIATLAVCAVGAALLWLYNDGRSLGAASDAVQDQHKPTSPRVEDAPRAEATEAVRWVAPLLALAELIICLGAGMTVKFVRHANSACLLPPPVSPPVPPSTHLRTSRGNRGGSEPL